jgi:hypothetical protein
MLFSNRSRNCNWQRSIEPHKHRTSGSLRLALLFVTALLAFHGSQCLASASGTTDDDGTAVTRSAPQPWSNRAPQRRRQGELAALKEDVNLATGGGTVSPNAATRLDGSSANSTTEGAENAPAFTSNDPAPAVHGLSNGLVDGDKNPISHLQSPKCILFPESFCRATRNKPILALTTMQTAALVSDGVTTRQFLRRGYVEIDPVARILIGRKPTWARMAPLGAVQVVAGMWLAEQMASSRHDWVRRLWWLPQVIGIAGNAASSAHNVALR